MKKFIIFCMLLCALCALVTVSAGATTTSPITVSSEGTTYTLYDQDGDGIPEKLEIRGIYIPDGTPELGSIMNTLELPNVKGVTEVVIAQGVESIGDYAFKDFTSLTKITIPDTVLSIGDECFTGDIQLVDILFYDDPDLDSIGAYAFAGCENLEDTDFFDLPRLTIVGKNAFSNTAYRYFVLPPSVQNAREDVFYHTEDHLDQGVLYVPNRLFGTSFTSGIVCGYTLDRSAQTATVSQMSKNDGISGDFVPLSSICGYPLVAIQEIAEGVQVRCPGHRIENHSCAFCGDAVRCGTDSHWEFDAQTGTLYIIGTGDMKNYNYYGKASPWTALHGNDIKEVVIDAGITSIGMDAFYQLPLLKRVTLRGNAIQRIGETAFSRCASLSKIVGLQNQPLVFVRVGAFSGCNSMQAFTFGAETDSINFFYNAFMNITPKIALGTNAIWGGANATKETMFGNAELMLYEMDGERRLIRVPFVDMLSADTADILSIGELRALVRIKDEYQNGYLFDGNTYIPAIDWERITISVKEGEINAPGTYTLQLTYCFVTDKDDMTKTIELPLTVVAHTKHSGGTATCTQVAVCALCEAPYGTPLGHSYHGDCDTDCNACSETRSATAHTYDNACDADCNVCGETRTPAAHVHDNDCDADCNVCGATRTTAHADADGDNTCDVCDAQLPKKGLPGGAIAGIAAGGTALLGGGGFALFWFVIKKKK